MRAMVFTGPGTLEMQDVAEPVAGPGEVLVDVAVSGICGSEIHGIGKPGFRVPPLVMGHEFAGTAADGRRVTVNPVVSCGACDLCRAGHTQLCRTRQVLGIHRPGAFAERVAVPASLVHELPADLPWERAAMVEPLANAVHAYALGAMVEHPERVAVLGAGTIGLVCLLVARSHGHDVTVVDLSADRLAVAERLGATAVATTLDGEYDLVIDAVGAAATRAAALAHVRPAGTTVWVGLLSDEPGFGAQDLVRMEKRVLGSFAYTDDEFAEALRLARTVDLDWVDSFPLEGGVEIFQDLVHGRTDVVKALLRP